VIIDKTERVYRVSSLLEKIKAVPVEWLEKPAEDKVSDKLSLIPCSSYSVLIASWKKAMCWTEGLECALSVMFASILSTKSIGDQLWIKIIGPASCGKTTLCEAISVNYKYVIALSTIRGFHSGYRTADGEDNSLIAKSRDKTLVTKDGDTLLQSSNLGKILSEARDIYDRVGRAHYLNTVSNDYTGINMTWILCGTSSLKSIDQSELGERFLDCVIMEQIDDDLEDEVLRRVATRTVRNLSYESNGEPESQYDEELIKAMQLTGGYVGHLRDNATQLLSNVTLPKEHSIKCIHLGKFVAYLRARPSIRQEEVVEREFGARLVSQIIRLTMCLAVVMNKRIVDEEVMKRAIKVARDTCAGHTLDITKVLYRSGQKGRTVRALSLETGYVEVNTKRMLRFLSRIGVVERFNARPKGKAVRVCWRLTSKLYKLYESTGIS
jgi:hypothetical protein